MMPEVRQRLRGRAPFSASGDPQVAVMLPAAASTGAMTKLNVGTMTFEVNEGSVGIRTALGATGPSVEIGQDASSLLFLHACDARARNATAYRLIHNFDDTADLLGHYEVLYADGFVATIPVRYGVNVLEQAWTPTARRDEYCYLADPVELAPGKTFFAYEWPNPRLGKVIKSVSFKGTSGFVGAMGQVLKNNGVVLRALTVVKPRPVKAVAAGAAKRIED
jgi:hypothetical protein